MKPVIIHKKTMGAVDRIWNGKWRIIQCRREPFYEPAKLSDFPELNPDDWWEIRTGSKLGKKVVRYYPEIEPVVDENGLLVDIKRSACRKEPKEEWLLEERLKGKRGQPHKNLMPFLQLERDR